MPDGEDGELQWDKVPEPFIAYQVRCFCFSKKKTSSSFVKRAQKAKIPVAFPLAAATQAQSAVGQAQASPLSTSPLSSANLIDAPVAEAPEDTDGADMVFNRKDGKVTVKAATLDKLIERLTYDRTPGIALC